MTFPAAVSVELTGRSVIQSVFTATERMSCFVVESDVNGAIREPCMYYAVTCNDRHLYVRCFYCRAFTRCQSADCVPSARKNDAYLYKITLPVVIRVIKYNIFIP